MTPVERACRALCLEDGLDPDSKFKSSNWGPECAPHEYAWQEYLPRVRLVLKAIREPSEAMVKAGVLAPNYLEDQSSNRGCTNIYTAMIDAILAGGE